MIPQDFPSLLRFCDGQSARSVHNRAPVTAPGGLPLFRVCKLSVPKELVGASGFEPPSSWSRTMNTNSINALSGVAYGTEKPCFPSFSCPYVARKYRRHPATIRKSTPVGGSAIGRGLTTRLTEWGRLPSPNGDHRSPSCPSCSDTVPSTE